MSQLSIGRSIAALSVAGRLEHRLDIREWQLLIERLEQVMRIQLSCLRKLMVNTQNSKLKVWLRKLELEQVAQGALVEIEKGSYRLVRDADGEVLELN